MEPLVSVICITRNHERFCIEALDSILNQTYKNLEWIILDAASTDNTPQIIDGWLVGNRVNAIFIKEKELKPITVNLNKTLTYAKGDYIQVISLDDVLIKDKIEIQVNKFKIDEKLGVIFGDALKIDTNGKYLDSIFGFNSRDKESLENDDIFKIIVNGNQICAATALVRKEVYRECGSYDENIHIEDWDFWLRVLKSSWKMKYFSHVLVKYRISENSLWHIGNSKIILSIIDILDKHNYSQCNNVLLNYFIYFKKNSINDKIKVFFGIIKRRKINLLLIYLCSILFYDREKIRKYSKKLTKFQYKK